MCSLLDEILSQAYTIVYLSKSYGFICMRTSRLTLAVLISFLCFVNRNDAKFSA